MMKRKSVAIGVAVLVPVLILGVLVSVTYSSAQTFQQKVEERADLPLLLQPEDYGKGSARGEIVLQEDGIAVLEDFPVGAIDQAGGYCTRWDGVSTFSGEAQWTVNRDYVLSVATSDGDVSIGPYAPSFGDLSWNRFGLQLCGDMETLWYWRAEE